MSRKKQNRTVPRSKLMTAKKARKSKKAKSLSHGRPPSFKRAASMSSKATRTIIRSHHQLQKAHAKALADNDEETAATLSMQIEQQGGLKAYQQASITGQSSERGGDSSRVLMEWLSPLREKLLVSAQARNTRRLRMLEVGALAVNNACSRSGLFDVTRIDLNSQNELILQEDFMTRPLPTVDADKFDIISLSLVLNYVPTAAGRGEMLRRSSKFLRTQQSGTAGAEYFPSVFVVLPAPCITNSRYLDEERFSAIMTELGFVLSKRKLSSKLAYFLWRYEGDKGSSKSFPKIEVNSGARRNNFTIILGQET